MTSKRLLALVLFASAGAVSVAHAATLAQKPSQAPTSPFTGLKYRLVGPFRGGRVTGVAGVPGDPSTYYFGAASGGLWKTTDGGVVWKPLWDDFPEASPAVGAIAVARSDPKTIYVGTGEINIRGNVLTGNGLYKSTDAGKTWRFSGLRDSQVIGRIIVDPTNPNIVFVAALGHTFGENEERGVFKSVDGGATWKKVLYVDRKTGASDVAFDPSNPKVLYAGMWQAYRKPWIMESGGPGSGLYKSVDGGETWTRLSGGGLPEGILGRINVAPTPDPKRVYAMIEAKHGGLYRSDDGGKTWALINDKNDYRQRAWYFNTVFADPKKADTLYVLNTGLYRSTDAGKTFKTLHPRHGDNHELWIDPTDTRHMVEGNDGGANVSLDNGETWSSELNQPTAQFYHIAADDRFPFHIMGAQQDNTTVETATAGRSGVGLEDWYEVGGGESGYVVPDPTDPEIVYAGGYDAEITRFDHRTATSRQITPWPRNTMGWAPQDLKYRFQWTAPIMVSRHAPHALYFGAQVLFRSLDQGDSWTVISPDLTRNDKTKQQSSGGPLTKDNTSVETYGTIFSVAESPVQKDLIWTGSDDGLIHITQTGGGVWADVTPKAMPEWATVDMVEADPHAPSTAYVAADRHRLDDFKPYAFRTEDFGKTWTPIANGIPEGAYVHVVRADPARKGLLYAGTEQGVFVSFDDGARWRPLRLNLPVVPVHDLVVHGDSLAVATHGRSFWIIDDLSPVRQWSEAAAGEKAHLFRPAAANHTSFGGRGGGEGDPSAPNPPTGAQVFYTLAASVGSPRPAPGAESDKDKKDGDEKAENKKDGGHKDAKPDPWASRLKIEILDAGGHVVRTFPTPKPPVADDADEDEDEGPRSPKAVKLSHFAGLNSFAWDLRYESAVAIPHSPLWAGSVAGPKAMPGRYQVRLTVDGASQTQPLEIVADPRETITPEQYRKQFELHSAIDAELTTVHEAVLDIRAVRDRIHEAVKASAAKPDASQVAAAADALDRKMTGIEEVLIQPRAHASEDALNYPVQLNNMLAALGNLVGSGDAEPTSQDQQMFAELKAKSDQQLMAWRTLKTNDVPAFDRLTGK
ncbi:glycosyl hydrolase [Caulobacter sp. S45]|uniref:WD40/YVTN/BNR-like repeat-containing protein n=1 Tax=Caulobacter sp. S45 TaxID=1641861 RepID=UPI00131BE9E9|nr:glycosyl hydrolase [Caulobacter sp. S45]